MLRSSKPPRHPPSWFSQRAKWIFAEPGQSSLDVRTSSLYWYQPGRISRVEGDWSKFNQMHVAMIERGWEVLVGHAVDGVSHTLRWHGKAAWVSLRILSIPPRPGAREAIFPSVRGPEFLSSYLSLSIAQKKMQQEIGVMGSFFAQRSSKGKEGKHQKQQSPSGGHNQQGVSGGKALEGRKGKHRNQQKGGQALQQSRRAERIIEMQ